MNPSLKDFFEEEKKRVFRPDSHFHLRVMARLRERGGRAYDIWNLVPSATRPVFTLALTLLMAFVALQVMMPRLPILPERGFVEAFFDAEQSPSEAFLYTDTDFPTDPDFLNQLMGSEEQQ